MNARYIAGIAAGAAIGGAIGYMIGKRLTQPGPEYVEYDDPLEGEVVYEDLDDAPEATFPTEEQWAEFHSANLEDPLEEDEDEEDEDEEEMDPVKRAKKKPPKYIPYNAAARPSPQRLASKYQGRATVQAERSYETPYIISVDEFAGENPGWESVRLVYYAEDGVLLDENENIIDDRVRRLGQDDLEEAFGQDSGDPDTVYIRSEKEGRIYEIVRLYGSWAEMVDLKSDIEDIDIVPEKPKRKRKSRAKED